MNFYKENSTLLGWKVFFTLIFFHSLCHTSATAQKRIYQFEHYSSEEGLPMLQTYHVTQDSYGFLWLSGLTGLYKFDGYKFTVFSHATSEDSQIPLSATHFTFEDSQKRLWILTPSMICQYDRSNNTFVTINRLSETQEIENTSKGFVTMFEAQDNQLWVGTDKQLLKFFPEQDSFEIIPNELNIQSNFVMYQIAQDSEAQIWIASNKGLFKLNKYQDMLLYEYLPPEKIIQRDELVLHAIHVESINKFWLGTHNGIRLWNPLTKELSKPNLSDDLVRLVANDFMDDGKGNLWIATDNNGIIKIRLSDGSYEHFTESPFREKGMKSKQIYSLTKDTNENIWFTSINGVQKINFKDSKFPLYQVKEDITTSENHVTRIFQDYKNGIWLTISRKGAFYSPQLGGEMMQIEDYSFQTIENVINQNAIWGGMKHQVIECNLENLNCEKLNLGDTISRSIILSIKKDAHHDSRIIIGTTEGLCIVDENTLARKWVFPFESNQNNSQQVDCIIQLPDGNFLARVGSFRPLKLGLYNPKKETFINLFSNIGPDAKIWDAGIRNMVYTDEGIVWIATSNGLFTFDLEKNSLDRIPNLPCSDMASVSKDRAGDLWIACNSYILKYDHIIDSFIQHDVSREMIDFYGKSYAYGNQGEILLGGTSGLYVFQPSLIKSDTVPPKMVLTNFEILNQAHDFGKAPEMIKQITLRSEENVFSFEFAALHYTNPAKNQYQYKLEGFDKDWIQSGSERKATYTNLNPGNYTFHAKGSNADGVWNKPQDNLVIQITILPPWYRTWLAISLWIILFLGSLYAIYRFQLSRQLAINDAKRLQEIDTAKNQLYTNITHEFRTPLTVILGMADHIEKDTTQWLEKGLQLIRRNGQQLLNLVNQMLDLSKLESNTLAVQLIQADLIGYLNYLIESFHSLAASKDIQLHFLPEMDSLIIDYDPEKMQSIVSNLLSNAIKYSPPKTSVYLLVQTTPNELQLKVRDNGIGIAADQLENIFNRFYQVDDSSTRKGEGTGIGLALTKGLVSLLGGEMKVNSKLGKGSEFIVQLPISKNAQQQEVLTPSSVMANTVQTNDAELPTSTQEEATLNTLLIIEDNEDVIQYLISCLATDYQITIAKDGAEGIEKALQLVPDLILSDVMMPKKDGYEVCAALKKDMRTSHIPIVLLTAKADIQSKIEGLEVGADVYLAKPFHEVELKIRLQKLHELRQQLQRKYSDPRNTDTTSTPSLEEEFLQKMQTVIHNNLDNHHFDVTQLCREMQMARTPIHNKIKALTGKSTTEYIRAIRLEEGRKLLLTTDLNISSIAYDVGFKSPTYFSQQFKKIYGSSPSEYRL